MKTEKKALLGGSFDPVHMGHINLFHNISTLTDITTLYVVPAYVSAFKVGHQSASFDDRMAMLNYAILDYSDLYPLDDLCIVVSDWEGERGGVSYTSETVKHFFDEAEDNGKVNFVVGTDIIPTLPKWHDWEYLKTHVRFFSFKRGEEDVTIPEGVEIIFIDSPLTDASSTEIRSGDRSMLSPSVLEYINDTGLYKD
ncbi:MAG: nicotinate (nicotinamide) nucleotide adenylyltransferase [Spirochaetales bacterium]|nr:nicotinate (nicotinamide) nucleotide adenylyltransferase [Spirochaetales bacterium]